MKKIFVKITNVGKTIKNKSFQNQIKNKSSIYSLS